MHPARFRTATSQPPVQTLTQEGRDPLHPFNSSLVYGRCRPLRYDSLSVCIACSRGTVRRRRNQSSLTSHRGGCHKLVRTGWSFRFRYFDHFAFDHRATVSQSAIYQRIRCCFQSCNLQLLRWSHPCGRGFVLWPFGGPPTAPLIWELQSLWLYCSYCGTFSVSAAIRAVSRRLKPSGQAPWRTAVTRELLVSCQRRRWDSGVHSTRDRPWVWPGHSE